jgi:hypothetical protein
LNGSRPRDWAPVCDGEGSCQRRLPVGRSPLVYRMLEITEISNSGRRDLFGLFSKHYDDVDLPRFESDFTAKDFALVLEYQGDRWASRRLHLYTLRQARRGGAAAVLAGQHGLVSAARQRGARKAVPYNFKKLVGLTFKSSRTI